MVTSILGQMARLPERLRAGADALKDEDSRRALNADRVWLRARHGAKPSPRLVFHRSRSTAGRMGADARRVQ